MTQEMRGDTLVLGLVLSLVAFLLIVFTVFTVNLDADDRTALVPGVARLAHSAFAGLGLLAGYGAYKRDRNGWWWYIVGALLPIVQLAVIALWFGRTRSEPLRVGRWTL